MATRLGQKFKEKLEKKPTDLTLLTDVDFDEIGEVVAKPVLRLLCLVCRRSILLEGPGRVAEVSQGPWQNFRPQHFPILRPTDFDTRGDEEQRGLAVMRDSRPNHDLFRLLLPLDNPTFKRRILKTQKFRNFKRNQPLTNADRFADCVFARYRTTSHR